MNLISGRQLYKNYEAYDQKEVELCGWVKSNRGSKNFGFLIVNDGTFFEPIQVVYDKEMENFGGNCKAKCGNGSDRVWNADGNSRSKAAI